MTIEPIAYFHSPFKEKFGIPKQSGIVETLVGQIVFVPEFRNAQALRGLEGFDYIWLIWGFSANSHSASTLLVRPPLLGGNERMGVFATRSPFRPNPIGLSSVRLQKIDYDRKDAPVIHVLGADLMNDTPIYDIKPYIILSDCHKEARCGFVDNNDIKKLNVVLEDIEKIEISNEDLKTLIEILRFDPRPHYHKDANRVYGMSYNGCEVKFRVEGSILYLMTVCRKFDV